MTEEARHEKEAIATSGRGAAKLDVVVPISPDNVSTEEARHPVHSIDHGYCAELLVLESTHATTLEPVA
jgi:hypothetical protein